MKKDKTLVSHSNKLYYVSFYSQTGTVHGNKCLYNFIIGNRRIRWMVLQAKTMTYSTNTKTKSMRLMCMTEKRKKGNRRSSQLHDLNTNLNVPERNERKVTTLPRNFSKSQFPRREQIKRQGGKLLHITYKFLHNIVDIFRHIFHVFLEKALDLGGNLRIREYTPPPIFGNSLM